MHIEANILEIIQSQSVKDQHMLQRLLSDKGIHVPQATLSRKLKKLNIKKNNGKYESLLHKESKHPKIIRASVSDFGIVVFHTEPGNANALAYYLDQTFVFIDAPLLLGTIAGDDTVLAITKNKETALFFLENI